MFGFKIFAILGTIAALLGAFAMVVQSIKAGERNRINAELAAQKIELARKADEALDAATAKLFSERRERKEEREDLNAYIATLETRDDCLLPDAFLGELREFLGSAGPGEAAPSE